MLPVAYDDEAIFEYLWEARGYEGRRGVRTIGRGRSGRPGWGAIEMRRMLAVPCANGVDPACWWARGTTWAVVRSHATLHARLR